MLDFVVCVSDSAQTVEQGGVKISQQEEITLYVDVGNNTFT